MIFRPPYRWLWRTILPNLRCCWYDLKYGVRNLWLFWNDVWFFNACDYSHLLGLMRIGTRLMRDLHRDHGNTVSAPQIARQLTIVTELCRRLEEDNYFTNAGHNRNTWRQISDFECRRICEHSKKMAEQDAAYLGKMFRHIQRWWD